MVHTSSSGRDAVPFAGTKLTSQDSFNFYQSQGSLTIEPTFGIMVSVCMVNGNCEKDNLVQSAATKTAHQRAPNQHCSKVTTKGFVSMLKEIDVNFCKRLCWLYARGASFLHTSGRTDTLASLRGIPFRLWALINSIVRLHNFCRRRRMNLLLEGLVMKALLPSTSVITTTWAATTTRRSP